jgi:hypothetical protein
VRNTEVAAVGVEVFVDAQHAIQRIELRDNSDQPPRMGRMPDHVDARNANPAASGQRAKGRGCGRGTPFARTLPATAVIVSKKRY